ncbi:MAG: iron ABC transporter permease, partial [Rothia mucilaginosa]
SVALRPEPAAVGLGAVGALMVLGSDLIGRFAVPGRIIQVGVVTGAIGGLYLIYLIYLERKKS